MANVKVIHAGTSLPLARTVNWWAEENEDEDLWKHVRNLYRVLKQRQAYREVLSLRFAQLYGNLEMLGLSAAMYTTFNTSQFVSNRCTLNVIQNCVDAATAKIGKNRPRPMYLTNKGDWSQQRRAKDLTDYVGGVFEEARTYEQTQFSFVHAGVFGTGIVKPYIDWQTKKICTDWVFPHECIIDDVEAIYGNPHNFYEGRYVSRETLLNQFPKFEAEIRRAPAGAPEETLPSMSPDMIYAVEAWHLGSREDRSDGRHCLCIEGATLMNKGDDTKYTKANFPHVFFRWSPRVIGFWGSGIAEAIYGIQLQIGRTLKDVEQAQKLACVPRVFAQQGSIIKGSISDEIGGFVWYAPGMQPPTFSVAPGMPEEVYKHLWDLYGKAYEIIGISELSAASKKPAGLNSGRALEEFNDIGTERFAVVGQRWEKFHTDIADRIIDLSKDLAEMGKEEGKEEGWEGTVKIKQSKWIKKIKWKDVQMDEDDYITQVFPTSLLPTTPAGRLEWIDYMVKNGWVGREHAMSLVDFPDVEDFISLQTSAIEDIKFCVSQMLDENKQAVPEPYMDLATALKMAQSAYLRAKQDNCPDERLQLLRNFMDNVLVMLQAAQQPQQAPLQQPQPNPTALAPAAVGAPAAANLPPAPMPVGAMPQAMPAAPAPGMPQ